MAEPHVVAALKDKRAELSGNISDLEKRIGQHRADLLHVDAVLRLFAPEFEPATIPPRAVRRPNSWFKPGELARLLLEVLRTAPAALSVREITVQVMERRGLDPQDARTAELLRKLVSNALNRQDAALGARVPGGGGAAQGAQQCPDPAARRSGRADPGRCPGQLAGARVIRRRGGCVASS